MALIYAIRSSQTDQYYVGSTTQTLTQRFSVHKSKGDSTSQEIIKYGDAYIELLEECDIEVRFERERFHIENGNVVNKLCPVRSEEERRAIKKAYYKENIDEIKAKVKSYKDANAAEIKQQRKAYRDLHKEEINAKKRQQYEMSKLK